MLRTGCVENCSSGLEFVSEFGYVVCSPTYVVGQCVTLEVPERYMSKSSQTQDFLRDRMSGEATGSGSVVQSLQDGI